MVCMLTVFQGITKDRACLRVIKTHTFVSKPNLYVNIAFRSLGLKPIQQLIMKPPTRQEHRYTKVEYFALATK